MSFSSKQRCSVSRFPSFEVANQTIAQIGLLAIGKEACVSLQSEKKRDLRTLTSIHASMVNLK